MAAIDACIGDGVTPNSGCAYGEIPSWSTGLVTDMNRAFGCRGVGGCAVVHCAHLSWTRWCGVNCNGWSQAKLDFLMEP